MLDDLSTIVCLTDLHEIAIPWKLNTYHICDLASCGSERYPALAYPNNFYFDSFG